MVPSSREIKKTFILLGDSQSAKPNHWKTDVKVKVILPLTVSWPVCTDTTAPSETCDQFFFLCHGNYLQTRVAS